MVLEMVDIRIHPDRNAEFETAIYHGIETVMSHAAGFRGHRLHRGIESLDRYVLIIEWDSLADHTVGFRNGPLFAPWRSIVGPFFAAPPVVEHFEVVTYK